jgi:hypothetical protein
MPEGGPSDLNLSGLWNGLYSYPPGRGREPVEFSAALRERDGWIEGSTSEIGEAGEALGQTLTATIQGRRTGLSVTFLKTYDGAFRHYDAVQYVGEVRNDGEEIEGKWTVPGSWSGAFLMIRSGPAPQAQEARTVERAGQDR